MCLIRNLHYFTFPLLIVSGVYHQPVKTSAPNTKRGKQLANQVHLKHEIMCMCVICFIIVRFVLYFFNFILYVAASA